MTTSSRSSSSHNALQQAKVPQTPLAGPYGHPFHPILVTVPIGAWVSSLVFDIATQVKDKGSEQLTYASYWLILIGIIGAGLAALFGLMDLVRLPRGSKALKMGLTHMALNVGVLAAFIVNFVWRHDDYTSYTRVGGGQLALSAVALGFLGISGWIGGMLAYKYGVRVADQEVQLEAYESYGTTSTTRAPV